jgi:hypothetical protein
MTNGAGAQTDPQDRWGDYTYTAIDPSDGMTFWHVNEYYPLTSDASWSTRIGKFNFIGGGSPTPTPTTPTPTPTATATATVTPSATPTATVRPVPTPRPRPTPHPRL